MSHTVQFCHIPEGSDEKDSDILGWQTRTPTTIVLKKHNTPLKTLDVDISRIIGCCHDREKCALCSEINADDDPFLAFDEHNAERNTVLHLAALSRGTARDAITWVMAHKEWLRAPGLKFYFQEKYTALQNAMTEVNALGANQLTGRVLVTLKYGICDKTEAPVYCSWLFLPRPVFSRVFYIPTRVPSNEMIHDYLNTMLGLPREFTQMIIRATVADESQDRILQYRTSSRKSLKSPRPVEAMEGFEVEDARRARADRLEKRTDLRSLFNIDNPRLVLVSETGRIRRLEPRPDYLLKRHDYYLNVFFITLPDNAPKHYAEAVSAAEEKW